MTFHIFCLRALLSDNSHWIDSVCVKWPLNWPPEHVTTYKCTFSVFCYQNNTGRIPGVGVELRFCCYWREGLISWRMEGRRWHSALNAPPSSTSTGPCGFRGTCSTWWTRLSWRRWAATHHWHVFEWMTLVISPITPWLTGVDWLCPGGERHSQLWPQWVYQTKSRHCCISGLQVLQKCSWERPHHTWNTGTVRVCVSIWLSQGCGHFMCCCVRFYKRKSQYQAASWRWPTSVPELQDIKPSSRSQWHSPPCPSIWWRWGNV